MSTTLTVLCPNGRRQTVKAVQAASTPVLTILEEVCLKQALDAADFELVHQRRSLDLALSLRLSGVPNNAVLELRRLDVPRRFADVTIALQLDDADGSRLPQKTFRPDAVALYEVLEAYASESPLVADALKSAADETTSTTCDDNHLVCAYLNEQAVGAYQLKHTTLKDMGLTSGRGLVRFGRRHIDKQQFDKLDAEFRARLARRDKLAQAFEENKKQQQQQQEQQQRQRADNDAPPPPPPPQIQQKQEEADKEPPPAINVNVSVPPLEKRQRVQPPREEAAAAAAAVVVENEFANFKFPAETRNQDLSALGVSVNPLADIERMSKEPCERHAILFSMQQQQRTNNNEDEEELSDEFFDVTVQDVRYMLSDLRQRQGPDSSDAPLMTKQMRELADDRRAMKYSQVVVRVAGFRDQLVLQGLFRPKEKVAALYAFVKECLESNSNSVDDLDFYLFSTPPRHVLADMQRTLFEQQLCPAALVYFKNKSKRTPVFRADLVAALETTTTMADNNNTLYVEANRLVVEHVHGSMRKDLDDSGMSWLQQEHQLVQNIMRSVAMTAGGIA